MFWKYWLTGFSFKLVCLIDHCLYHSPIKMNLELYFTGNWKQLSWQDNDPIKAYKRKFSSRVASQCVFDFAHPH